MNLNEKVTAVKEKGGNINPLREEFVEQLQSENERQTVKLGPIAKENTGRED